MKISYKFILLISILVIISIVITGVVYYSIAKQSIEERVESQLESVSILKRNQFDDFTKRISNDLESVSQDKLFVDLFLNAQRSYTDQEQDEANYIKSTRQLLEEKLIYKKDFFEFFVIDLDGKIYASTDEDQEEKFKSNESYFIEGKKERFIQHFYYDLSLLKSAMTVSVPVNDNEGEVIGVLAGRIDLVKISEFMEERSGLGETGETYLVNKYNMVVTELRGEEGAALRNLIQTEGLKNCLKGNKGFNYYDNYQKIPVVGYYVWIPKEEICLLTEINQVEALLPIKKLGFSIILISSGLIPLIIIFGIFLSRTITSPIFKLRDAIVKIKKGTLDSKIDIKSNDEIGQLGNAFNVMAKQLGISKKKLEDYSKNLEFIVEQRTRELQETNETLKQEIAVRKHTEVELTIAKEQAEAGTQVKSEFLANMSHELRTPLNAVIGFSEILGDQTFGELNEKQARYINHVLTSGRHLLQLINDVLDISKVEAEKMELEPSRVNIKSLLENCLTMINGKAMKDGIRLDTHISQELMDLDISVDERKLKQIIFNLLSNAAKFTQEGGSIRLEANLISDFGMQNAELKEQQSKIQHLKSKMRGSAIEVSVADSGIGIKPENQERIFGEFEQVDSTYAREQGGTGLGLTLTRKLVELHGGWIWVESEGEGKGSTFTFVIPVEILVKTEEAKDEDLIHQTSKAKKADRSLVLVVEDDRAASELLTEYLSDAGYAVAHAFDGEQAVQMAHEMRPCAITLDIILPKKDGWEVLKELKSLSGTKDIPVIVVSITKARRLGFSLGAIEWFVKPVEKNELIAALNNVSAIYVKKDLTVLVVDDEPEAVALLTDMLESEDYKVLQAYGGQEGIDLAVEKHPDAIILDLMMPEVNGFEVVQQLRVHPEAQEIPIIIHTGKDLTPADRQRLSRHVQAVSSKSSGKEQLLGELEKLRRVRQGKG